jgi:HxlR-like helix-turn-helix
MQAAMIQDGTTPQIRFGETEPQTRPLGEQGGVCALSHQRHAAALTPADFARHRLCFEQQVGGSVPTRLRRIPSSRSSTAWQLEQGGVVRRIVHHQVPPKVEYALTDWGQALCPALGEMLKWAASRDEFD